MMKKALMTASMASMLDYFNRSNIRLLLECGYEVTLAANFCSDGNTRPLPQIRVFKEEMETLGCRVVHVDFSRNPGDISSHLQSYRQLKELAEEGFSLVHCHAPICAAITRLAFRKKRKNGTRVVYTAHGFHFYKGAPIKNWLLYFPVEWVCARWTDILNTINREDYQRARKWLKAGKVTYLPGAGIDMKRFQPGSADRKTVRRELGIREDEKMLLSVGELSRRKNQGIVIKALSLLGKGSSLCYVICGQGGLEKEWRELAIKLGVADQVLFLGYREDISELCQAADLFVFPSLQEGLPMALMEAIAVKTSVVCSDIRGNRELVPEEELRFDQKDAGDTAACIQRALGSDLAQTVEEHFLSLRKYRLETVEKLMKEEYL